MVDCTDTRITVDDEGFIAIPADGKRNRVRWADIEEIRAFRIRLSSEDEIRIAVGVEPDYWTELSNKQTGFGKFVHQLQLRFPTVAGWQAAVQCPDMFRSGIVLYRRI
jgi:hypothetical protein